MAKRFSSVQSLSCVRLFATPWIAARQASLSSTNSQRSPRLMSIKSVMPPAISCSVVPSPPAPNPSQHQSLFQWVSSSHKWPLFHPVSNWWNQDSDPRPIYIRTWAQNNHLTQEWEDLKGLTKKIGVSVSGVKIGSLSHNPLVILIGMVHHYFTSIALSDDFANNANWKLASIYWLVPWL